MSSTLKLKKALVHDWFYVDGGAEKVVHSFNKIWGDFDQFGLIDFLNDKDRDFIVNGKSINTSFIQNLPGAKKNHRKYLQLFPYAIEQFDLSKYDVILSSSASIAKGVLTHHNQLHICYCHSPMRYAWDFYHDYLNRTGLTKGIKGAYAKYVLHKTRQWDVLNSNRVDHFIANSNYIAARIHKIYRRESTVIYPPVNVEKYSLKTEKQDYYFTASRLVPYKRIDLIVKAFNKMPNKTLIVAGDGQDYKKIKKIAGANIKLKGFLAQNELNEYMQNAKAFVFAAEEDFGIVPVEAQACGTPVIAYGKGGLLETVIDGVTGTFFHEQTEESIVDAVQKFESLTFDYKKIRAHSEKFSKARFEAEIKTFVDTKYAEFLASRM